jgi:uncharacterized protein (UPF0332 family)
VNVDECLAKGLLKKTAPDREKAAASLDAARRKIGIAEAELKAGIYENALTTAYAAFFHTARALLYKDGFKERSHFAISVYVAEKYGDLLEKRFVNELDNLRETRHLLTYGLTGVPQVGEKDAHEAIAAAKDFLSAVKRLA